MPRLDDSPSVHGCLLPHVYRYWYPPAIYPRLPRSAPSNFDEWSTRLRAMTVGKRLLAVLTAHPSDRVRSCLSDWDRREDKLPRCRRKPDRDRRPRLLGASGLSAHPSNAVVGLQPRLRSPGPHGADSSSASDSGLCRVSALPRPSLTVRHATSVPVCAVPRHGPVSTGTGYSQRKYRIATNPKIKA